MATEVGSLYYDLDIDDKKLSSALSRADKNVSSFGDKVGAYWGKATESSKLFAAGIAAAGVAVAAFGYKSVQAYQEAENVAAQTNAVIKSTGGVAGVSAGEVSRLATSLQGVTRFSDETIQSGENLLLTFTAIGKDIFPQATKTMLDMSQALGQDTKSSAIQLGKALQDPILGVTALRRVGVNFSKDQQEVIKKLVETGDKAKAQQLILKELNTEFGGSAKAAGQTFAGQLDILKNTFGDVMERVGEFITDSIRPLVEGFNDWVEKVGGVEGIMKTLGQTFKKIQPYLPAIIGAIVFGLVPAFIALAAAVWSAVAPLLPFLAAGALVGALLSKLAEQAGGWGALWEIIKQKMQPVIDVLNATLVPALKILWDVIQHQLIPALKELWEKHGEQIKQVFTFLAAVLGGLVLTSVLMLVGHLIVFITIISSIITVVTTVISWLKNFGDNMENLGSRTMSTARQMGASLAEFSRGIGASLAAGINYARNFIGNLIGAFSGAGSWLYRSGVELVQGLIRGVQAAYGQAVAYIRGLGDSIKSSFRATLSIKSPSKVFQGYGKNITDGLIMGMEKGMGAIDAQVAALVSPNMPALAGGGDGSSTSYDNSTSITIGTIQDRQDADYLIARIDRNQTLSSRGGSPQWQT